ncbi:DEKNAAC102787 [Brettanomyces naardenensis]|uniref:DEKNAAC102787 n=1 Tax=Brettanomyces naardenensis TaxID=13370 RepID=A0A448YKB6_BRENA|nr:DEKNAAC102787 [Brettanomyces naardenensis]
MLGSVQSTLWSLVLLVCVAQALPWELEYRLTAVKERLADLFKPYPGPSEVSLPPEFDSRPELFKLHRDIVSVESESFKEQKGSAFLRKYLQSKGLTVEYIDVRGGRQNVYAYLGNAKNTSVLLTSHIDTVPPFFKYSARKEDDGIKIYGRGTADAKGSIASQIVAFEELLQEGTIGEGDVSLLYVVGEEAGGEGMIAANTSFVESNVNWDAVIFGEPTTNALAVGHKGIYTFRIHVYGKASHSAYPELGVDANKVLIEILHSFEHAEWPGSKMLGDTTINIGLFDAHNAANVVSPYAAASVLIRVASTTKEVSKLVSDIVDKYKEQALRVEIDTIHAVEPTYLDYDVPGFNSSFLSCYTDVPSLGERGFKRYLYGPGSIHDAHGATEYVSLQSLTQAVDDYKKLILHALGKVEEDKE